jgi:hypothetical protein
VQGASLDAVRNNGMAVVRDGKNHRAREGTPQPALEGLPGPLVNEEPWRGGRKDETQLGPNPFGYPNGCRNLPGAGHARRTGSARTEKRHDASTAHLWPPTVRLEDGRESVKEGTFSVLNQSVEEEGTGPHWPWVRALCSEGEAVVRTTASA